MTSDSTLLEVRDLTKSFGSLKAVADVSFNVAEAEILGIAGPNGAGKTTLFNLISALPFGPDSGEILLAGRRIDRMPAHRIFQLGLARTFQKETSFAKLTVAQNVRLGGAFGSGLGGRALDLAVQGTLERLSLLEVQDELAEALPIFEAKRLMIATAAVARPCLLLLDEPASGLNSVEQHELQRIIRDLHGDGMAIILIEHILPLLFGLSQRVLVMDFGRKLKEGPPEDIARDPEVIEAYLGGQMNDEPAHA